MARVIRRATAADAATIADLARRTFVETYAMFNTAENMRAHVVKHYGVEQQTREIATEGIVYLLALEDDVPAGYTMLRRRSPPSDAVGAEAIAADSIEVHRFYVDARWHGRGLAQTLMQTAADTARAAGAAALWLSVWEKNPRARAFYAKCGYEDVGTLIFVLGEDRQTDRLLRMQLRDVSVAPRSPARRDT